MVINQPKLYISKYLCLSGCLALCSFLPDFFFFSVYIFLLFKHFIINHKHKKKIDVIFCETNYYFYTGCNELSCLYTRWCFAVYYLREIRRVSYLLAHLCIGTRLKSGSVAFQSFMDLNFRTIDSSSYYPLGSDTT